MSFVEHSEPKEVKYSSRRFKPVIDKELVELRATLTDIKRFVLDLHTRLGDEHGRLQLPLESVLKEVLRVERIYGKG